MTVEILNYVNLAGIVAVLAFLWSLHRDMQSLGNRLSALAERIAKIEGALSMGEPMK